MKEKVPFNPFAGPEIERIIHTTQPQAELWIACKMGDIDANRAYNESVSLILDGSLNEQALRGAIQSLVERHEALRSVFNTDGRLMTIFKNLPITIDVRDLSKMSEIEKEECLKVYLAANSNYVFDLVKGPLFKVGLIKFSETVHHLILTAHHIICDGWSLGIILQEIGSLYSSLTLNNNHNLPKPESFCAYADEQQAYLVSEEHKTIENYWINQFKDKVPQLTLPTDFLRPSSRTFKSDRFDVSLESDLVEDLKKLGLRSGCSFVTTLLCAFEVFVYTQTGQEDIVLGLPSADQAASGKTHMIGHCVNLLPLRSKINTNITFSDYLKQRKPQLFDAYEHQKFSFGELLQKLSIARDPSKVPLVPVVFNIDMGMTDAVLFSGLSYKLKSNPRAYETFELFLNATGSSEELVLEWSYNSNLFKRETIQNMMNSFEEIINTVVSDSNIKIGDIIKMGASDYSELNNTSASYPQLPLHELLAKQAQITPLKQAIKFGNIEISYKNLEKQANQFAHYLVAQGVQNGDYVAVALPHSIELLVTLIGLMKCGAAYLPLDPKFPTNRLEFMLEDSEAKYLITKKGFSSSFKTSAQVLISEQIFLNLSKYLTSPVSIKVDVNNVVYMMYTSGSTGKPKGVLVTHKNFVNFLFSMLQEPGIKEIDRLLSITTISFDIAGLELFLPLLKGALLVLTNEETAKDPHLLLETMQNEAITLMQATPTTWQMLLDTGWETPLRIKALCGGEALPLGLAKKILERVDELWNVYGPTETTIWSAIKRIMMDDDVITIGHPIANTQIYTINEQNNLVRPNTLGEICIAGDGVTKGYWKRPGLTNEKFITNPFGTNPNSVLYRTGDLGKLLPNGDIQCLGRIDNQVKIRGHRIELGEIEQVLDTLEDVNSSLVTVKNDLLIANIISAQLKNLPETTVNNWKKKLAEILPSYMVPNQFNLMNKYPTTLNGKIDRKALTNSLSINYNYTKPIFNAPHSDSEQIIASIWQECLGIEKIDIQSDFFELGGHSLIAVKVMSLLEKQTGNRVPLAALLEHPTIQKLAVYMDKKFITWDSLVPLKPEGNKPPLFIVHGANHNVLVFKNIVDYVDDEQPVYALQAKGLSGEVDPHDSVEEMASHYIKEIKTINPEGPYALGGFSFGGIVAFEMAKQLKAQGKKVKIVALFDSYVYPSYYYSNPLVKKTVSTFYDIAQLIFMGLNMFSSKKNFKRRKDLLKIKISGWFLKMRYGREKQNQLQFNYSSKIDKMHALAFIRYNLIPQDIEVDLFRSTENIYFAHDYKYLGWRSIALKGIRKHLISGNHSEMFLSPAVEKVGSILQNVLDNYDSESYE